MRPRPRVRSRMRAGGAGGEAARQQLEALRARSLLEVVAVALSNPELLGKLVAQPVVQDGQEVGLATPEELAYIGRQLALSEEQVGRARCDGLRGRACIGPRRCPRRAPNACKEMHSLLMRPRPSKGAGLTAATLPFLHYLRPHRRRPRLS
jgi:hypothetical protein